MPIDDRDNAAGGGTHPGHGPGTVAQWDDGHPDAETLALYAERKLDADGRESVNRHISTCDDCREVLGSLSALLEAEAEAPLAAFPAPPLPFRRRRWVRGVAGGLAVAAALILAVRFAGLEWFGSGAPDVRALVAAYEDAPYRPVGGRLSGGFAHAAPPPLTRGDTSELGLTPDIRIAAARLEAAATGDSPAALWARGVARLAVRDYDDGIAALEKAAAGSEDAALLNDLSAAYVGRGANGGAREDFEKALGFADRALAQSPEMREALFNRALSLSGLNDPRAEAAWRLARAAEQDARWAAEAAAHLPVR